MAAAPQEEAAAFAAVVHHAPGRSTLLVPAPLLDIPRE
jgi:hypothetical protein